MRTCKKDVTQQDVTSVSFINPNPHLFHLLSQSFGSGGLPYLMDDLNCKGNEATLAECDFAGWGEHDCREAQVTTNEDVTKATL